MWDKFINITSTVCDLLALTTCIGTLGCRLWVLPTTISTTDTLDSKVLLTSLWWILAACITALILSSALLVVLRTAEMSSLPLVAIFPVLPKVLFKTHYGQIWLMRAAALLVLCVGWCAGRRRLDSRTIPTFMLGVGAIIAFTRSASNHTADAGDLSLPELMDWIHLMAASLWGGGLVVLSTIVLPIQIKYADQRRTLFANIAFQFSTLAGVALIVVLLTGTYNAWLQVGSFQALWETTYGRTLIAKLLLLLALIMLGASNRYISFPLLQQWAGHPLTKHGIIYTLFVARYVTYVQRGLDWAQITRKFMHKVWIEATLILAVLICAALLQHGVPARHLLHVGHEHTMEKSKIEKKKASTGYGFDRTVK